MNTKAKGYLLGAVAAATYGMNPLFALPLYKAGMDPDSVLFFRYLFAIPLLGIMLKARGRDFRLHRREIVPLVLLGLLVALSSLSLFLSYNYMDAGIASTLLFANLQMLDSYAGLTLPLMASATATFLFRQFFMTLPDELVEAARIDGASPMRFFCDIVFPLSKTNLAALFVITFIYGWNQYLWPLLIITDVDLGTTVAGIKGMIATGEGTTEWNSVMAAMLLTLIPPVVIVLVMQRAFVRGLVDSEK